MSKWPFISQQQARERVNRKTRELYVSRTGVDVTCHKLTDRAEQLMSELHLLGSCEVRAKARGRFLRIILPAQIDKGS